MRVALALLLFARMAAAGSRGTCLVTGGSRGIGAACCARLARDGYAVAVNYCSSASAAEAVVAKIEAEGHRAVALRADVSSEAGVLALFAQLDAVDGLPPLTALVNNAGIIGDKEALGDVTTSAFEAMMATNVLGPLMCCREAAARMAPGSAIVNLSSGSAYRRPTTGAFFRAILA